MSTGIGAATPPQGGRRTLLERLDDGEFLRNFLVVTIEVGAIRERLNHRWDRRKEQVWEHLERSVCKRLHGDEACQRISETTFLVGLMRETRHGSVMVASHALQDTLHFFLGAALLQDIHLKEVMAAVEGSLNCKAIDEREIRKAAASWVEGGANAPHADGDVVKFSPTVTIITASGRPIDVMIAVQRIQRLIKGRPTAVRASPHITDPVAGRRFTNDARRALDVADIAAIDAAVLGLTRQVWLAEPELGSIMVPLSFHTLSRTGARQKLLGQSGISIEEARTVMLCEIIDVSAGTPNGRICEAAALVQTFCQGVFMEAHEPAELRSALGACRLLGLTFDASDWTNEQTPALAKKLRGFVVGGKGLARGLVAHGLPSANLIELCAAAGLSHAAARARPSSPVVHINQRPVAARPPPVNKAASGPRG